jgi:hypothetical protein
VMSITTTDDDDWTKPTPLHLIFSGAKGRYEEEVGKVVSRVGGTILSECISLFMFSSFSYVWHSPFIEFVVCCPVG